MNARELTRRLDGRWHEGRAFGLAKCPAHDDSEPSFSIGTGNDGRLLVNCLAGCSFGAITAALRARGLWSGDADEAEAVDEAEQQRRARKREAEEAKRRECVLGLWRETRSAPGTLAEIYLKVRGVSLPVPPSIRFHSSLKHSGTGLYLPAMVAGICGLDRRVTAIHRTFLAEPGRKAEVSNNKMALGPIGAGSVHLAPAGEALGIAEGIETALSAMQIFRLPVWAACGSWLEKVAVPDTVSKVIVFADRGEAGEQAAEKAARVHVAAGRMVDVRFPSVGEDFNDQLRAVTAGIGISTPAGRGA